MKGLSLPSFFASFVFSVIGFWLLREAKKRANFSLAFIGIALILYTYFISNLWLTWGVGIILCALARQSL